MLPNKKRKVDKECRKFNSDWSFNYFFIEYNSKALCLICRESVAVFKETNVKHHYETKHKEEKYANLTGKFRTAQLELLKKKFAGENVSNLFQKQIQGKGRFKLKNSLLIFNKLFFKLFDWRN